jgi:CheY-like chemotaxis protein
MSNGIGTHWRFLIIEDDEDTARELNEAASDFVDSPDTAEAKIVTTFKEAAAIMKDTRYDLLILDLKDGSDAGLEADSNPAGLKIFEALKKARFVPVIFYTALPHKVRSEQTSFVRVVEKTEGIGKVKQEVKRVLATQLPSLARKLEDVQREYMWDFVSTHWLEFDSPHHQADLAYLLARRLAFALQGEARRLAQKLVGNEIPIAEPNNVHPMQMYVRPPVGKNRLAGDILRGIVGDQDGFWLVLTPSCDFEQQRQLQHVLLAQCVKLSGEPEYIAWKENPDDNDRKGPLKQLISDKRFQAQSERFKFLPGTYFLPDLVVDFQCLKAVPPEQVATLEVIASLDSPFAESVLSRFARYFGRLGTPDIDMNVVLNRLKTQLD